MRVFISWSGKRSKAVAELLKEWLGCVLQASKPWISSKDIDRGATWFSEINDQLKNTSLGIVCLTPENKDAAWILFEAGALAKGLSSGRVCTILIDMAPSDITDPLAQFNHTPLTKDGMRQLVGTLNKSLGDQALEEKQLDRVFTTNWPQFEEDLKRATVAPATSKQKAGRPPEEIMAEVLDNTRSLMSMLRSDRSNSLTPDASPLPSTGPYLLFNPDGSSSDFTQIVTMVADWKRTNVPKKNVTKYLENLGYSPHLVNKITEMADDKLKMISQIPVKRTKL